MLKGHATIELTDVNTGKKQVIEEDNLFTNAVDELINNNAFGRSVIGASPGDYSPLAKKALGGLLIFSEAITENVSTLYPKKIPFAYAGNNTDAGSDTRKGSYNTLESEQLTNGYKHVWDFTTSQGNGTISCLCLTHYRTGNLFPNSPLTTLSAIQAPDSWYYSCRCIDKSKNLFIGWNGNSNRFEVRKLNIPIATWPSVNAKLLSDIPDYSVVESIAISDSNDRTIVNSGGIIWRVVNGHCYGYAHSTNTSGDAYVYTLDINISTLNHAEGSMTISDTNLYSFKAEAGNCADFRDGYLYALSSGRTSVYKINMSNTTDITEIPVQRTDYMGVGYDEVTNWLNIGSNQILLEDDTVYYSENGITSGTGPVTIVSNGFREIVRAYEQDGYYRRSYIRDCFMNCYLATINNLQTPVIKTASQTMKITYTITDSQEVVLNSIAITTPPTRTTFSVGETLDLTGIVVTATMSDATTREVTSSCTFSPAAGTTLDTEGTQTVTATYTDGGITKTATFSISVVNEVTVVPNDATESMLFVAPVTADDTDQSMSFGSIGTADDTTETLDFNNN